MTLDGTNSWLVDDPSEGVWVIDPGPAQREHIERIADIAQLRGGLRGLALTHDHFDHSEGVDLLQRIAGPVELVSHPASRAGPLRALHTPGHAADHLCFFYEDICFSGDVILGKGSTIVPPGGGTLRAYMNSLRALAAEKPRLMCPGHGPVIDAPLAKVEQYLEHRLMRERGLIEALAQGERSRSRLLARVWSDVPESLRFAASFSMQSHLEKLKLDAALPDGIELEELDD